MQRKVIFDDEEELIVQTGPKSKELETNIEKKPIQQNNPQVNVIKKVFGKYQKDWQNSIKESIIDGKVVADPEKTFVGRITQSVDPNIYRARITKDEPFQNKLNVDSQKKNDMVKIHKFVNLPAEEHHLPIENISGQMGQKHSTNKNVEVSNESSLAVSVIKRQSTKEIRTITKEGEKESLPVFGINLEDNWDESVLD